MHPVANKKEIKLIDKFYSLSEEKDDYIIEENERYVSSIMKKINDDNIIWLFISIINLINHFCFHGSMKTNSLYEECSKKLDELNRDQVLFIIL